MDYKIDIPPTDFGFKLFRLRKDKTIGPLFINKRLVIPFNEWLRAENHLTPRFAYRPGWHVCSFPIAPHLSMKDRVWCAVEMDDCQLLKRPASQGGVWYLARWIKVLSVYNQH